MKNELNINRSEGLTWLIALHASTILLEENFFDNNAVV